MSKTLNAPSTVGAGSKVELPDGTSSTVDANGQVSVADEFVPSLIAAGFVVASLGESGDKISFLGGTAVAQRSGAGQALVTLTATPITPTAATVAATGATTTTPAGYTTTTQANAIITQVNAIVTDLATIQAAIAAIVTDLGALKTLDNQLRNDLVAFNLDKGSA